MSLSTPHFASLSTSAGKLLLFRHFTDDFSCDEQTERRAAQRPVEEVEAQAAAGNSSSCSSVRRAPRVTKATATMGSPDAVIHTDAASAASHSSLRSQRNSNNKRPNPLLEFDEEGAASLMEAFPLDVSILHRMVTCSPY